MTEQELERAKCIRGLSLTNEQILALDDLFVEASSAVIKYNVHHKEQERLSVKNGDRDRFFCDFVQDFLKSS